MAHSPVAILFTTASGGQSIATIDSNLGYLLGVTGSIGVDSPITGSVNVTNSLFSVTGSVGIVALPNITGSVNVTNSLFNVTGSVEITNQVRITTTGSIPVADNGGSLTIDSPQLPAALVGGRFDSNIGAWLGAITPTVGQKAMSASIPVVIASDQSGTFTVQGNAASGSTFQDNPVLIAGISSGNLVRIPALDADGTQIVRNKEESTYVAWVTGSAIGNNKSMLSILNGPSSNVILKIKEIWMTNVQTTAATGVAGIFEFRRMTSHSAGTQIGDIETMDTADNLNPNITARTNATIVGESTVLMGRKYWSTDDWGPGTLDTESNAVNMQNMVPVWVNHDNNMKPITLRAGQGLTVKHTVNSTAGTFDIMFKFTQV